MNWILDMPLEVRLIALFLIGAVLGGLVNLVVDQQRQETPRVSPWNSVVDWLRRLVGRARWLHAADRRAPNDRAPRNREFTPAPSLNEVGLLGLVPIVGWLAVAANSSTDRPRRFWLRPLMVELLLACAVAMLYWLEVGRWGLVPYLPDGFQPRVGLLPRSVDAVLHAQFFGHAVFLTFMFAASLIDLDEKVIPDAIAVSGTLAAIALAVFTPLSSLFDLLNPDVALGHLHWASPRDLAGGLAAGELRGLLLALSCVWLWCFGLLPRVWRLRRGWSTAVGLFWGRLTCDRWALAIPLVIGAALSALCVGVWRYGPASWTTLLSALVGMTVGSGIIWAIRIVSSYVLRREAMGFGDVTLMAMIGAFLGWQPTLVTFFLSPFFGLIPPVVALLMRGGASREIPFGPFLCLGAATTLLCWATIWPWLADVLGLFAGHGAMLVLGVIGGSLVAMIVLLYGVQLLKRAFA